MNKYEAMVIVKPDLPDTEKQTLFNSINEVVAKNNGKVYQAAVWSEKRKLTFPIKKQSEGIYYLVNFNAESGAIKEITRSYRINENILRVLITRQE